VSLIALRINVRVKPGTARTRVGGRYGESDQLIVAVTKPAVDGKANQAVLDAVADALEIHPRYVTLHSGHRARTKIIELRCENVDEIRKRVASLLAE
jgi:hypothetical protein